MNTKTIVIFDGDCDFCRSCVNWVSARCDIEALANQLIDPGKFGISREQCEKSVVVIDSKTYFGADAVVYLLEKSGSNKLARLLKLTGPIGELGYRYVASHRDGQLVKLIHWMVKKSASGKKEN